MVASKDKSFMDNTIKSKPLKKDRLLRSAAIYGANASGKSNVLKALSYIKRLVQTSHNYQSDTKIKYSPFKLDKKCRNKPSKFQIIFIKNDIKYIYGLSVTDVKVVDEYLYYYPGGRKSQIFDRKDTTTFTFKVDKKDQDFFADKTLGNVLYLSRATQLNYNRTKEAYNWFIENLMTVSPDNPRLQELSINLLNDNNTKDLIRNAMIRADVGIEEINARIIKFNYDQLPSDIPENLKKLMAEPDVTWMTPEIKTIHKGVSFDFSEESEGTIRVFDIIGCWIKALKDGKVLVVDELEIKLHPHLCSYLVTLFHDSSQNKNNAQLIFSTHNVYLLEQDIFRRDQIWFTEKIPETGQTDLYSLWEFSPRKDKNLKIGYLTGRYGALPFIQNKGLIS